MRFTTETSLIHDFSHLLEGAIQGKMLHVEGEIIEVDRDFCKILGYTEEELVGSKGINLIKEEYRKDVYERVEKHIEGNFALWMIRKNGQAFPVDLEVKVLEREGKVFHLVSIVDISIKKDAEEMLLASEMRFRIVTEHSSDITFIMATDGTCKYISSSIKQSIGFSSNELVGMVANHIFHPADLGKVVECKMKAIANPGEVIKLDSCRVKNKLTNEWVYFEGLFNYLPDAPGVEGVVVNCRVITERLRREEQLRESWERIGVTIDAVSDGYWDWNIQTGDVVFSDKWINNLGYDREDVQPNNKFWDHVIHADDLKKNKQELERHFYGGKELYECEYRILNKEGAYSWVLNKGKVVAWDENERPMRMVGTSVDITKNKEVESTKKRLEQKLQQAQKLETIGTLASGIAHDFKNLLNPIIGFSKLAIDDIHNPTKLKSDLEIILKASERANDLVNQILTFSKQTEIVKEPILLSHLVNEVTSLLDLNNDGNEVRILKEFQVDGEVCVDSIQLHQVIMNMSKNAIQAMEKQGDTLRIAISEKKHEGEDYVLLEFEDNGPGIDELIRERIFDPFFTTKISNTGTGLGLSVVHGIVSSHNGHIEVESKLGNGTRFSIYLPVLTSCDCDTVKKSKPVAVLVDDEEMSMLLLKRVLNNAGFECVTFDDGLEALKYISNHKDSIRILLCDESLPGISGSELCKIVKTFKNLNMHTILTTNNPHLFIGKMKEKGVNSLYIKPLNINDVSEKIRLILSNSKTISVE